MSQLRAPATLVAVSLGIAALLAGCTAAPTAPTPEPTPTADPELLLSVLSSELPEGVEESRHTDLSETTFGEGFAESSGTVHDDNRIAKAQGSYLSAGWADQTLGPGYWVIVELVAMNSVEAADSVMADVRADATADSTVEATDTTPEVEYRVPATQIRSEFPEGAVENEMTFVWANGARTDGWINYSSAGEFVLVVWGVSTELGGSSEAMDAFFDEQLPGLVERFEALPEASR